VVEDEAGTIDAMTPMADRYLRSYHQLAGSVPTAVIY
jgi:hypothetical protein